MASLKIGSFNVKGLRDVKKRRKIFQYLHQRNFDIICLQETHSHSDDVGLWSNEFGGRILFSHGSKDSKGVMILIRKNAPVKIGKTFSDLEGRTIACELGYEDKKFSLVNIYAPNKDDPIFFLSLFIKLAEFEIEIGCTNKVILGDFNLVLDLEKDKQGGNKSTHEKAANTLKSYMDDEALCDVWRLKHPDSTLMTWKVLKPKAIFERLDFILVSSDLVDNIKAEGIGTAYLSDHGIPWVVMSPIQAPKGRGFWKLNTRLLADKEYVQEIESLMAEILRENMDKVKKWEWLKHKIREHSIKYSARKNKDRVNKLLLYEKKLIDYNELLQLKYKADNRSNNDSIKSQSSDTSDDMTSKANAMSKKDILQQIDWIEKERDSIIEYKVRGSMLRARKNWTQYGEKPTSYFLNLEGRNYKRRNRYSIIDKHGRLISGIKNVLTEQRKFYEHLYSQQSHFEYEKFQKFTKHLNCQKIDELDYEMLEGEMTLQELKDAVFTSKKDKVAGSDGLCNEFYQVFFNIVKYLLLEICQLACIKGLHVSARQGIISLIEKANADLDKLGGWRPLSLLNCDGKFYSKILATRLEKVTKYLINTDQSGFQKGRSIHENLLDILSIIDYTEEKELPFLLVSFDFEKAFDKVNWDYLDKALGFFGIGQKFRQMVRNAHLDTKSCTVNGGFSSDYIEIHQGLRQGSPLSPALFNIAVEILSIAIRQNPDIIGLKIGEKVKKVGQFADDIWTVVAAKQEVVNALLKVFDEFAEISGLYINYDKSSILRIGSLRDSNFELTIDRPLRWSNVVKILGIVVQTDKDKMVSRNYEILIEKMKKTFDPWKARTMSLAGKITIVNTLILSQTVYKILCINTPSKQIIQRIKKLITEFIWNGKEGQDSL